MLAAVGLGFAFQALAGVARQPSAVAKAVRVVPVTMTRAQARDGPSDDLEDPAMLAKQALSGVAAAAVAAVSVAGSADAYPIFAQQNYENPREPTGKLACANCHLAGKNIDVRMPHEVLPDTIFKATIEIPAKYKKRYQPVASGDKATMNVGAIAVLPEGWKLAPKNRLPKPLKKQLKGLAWAPYSKTRPNIVVAGPVPGEKFEKMTLPILAPDPNNTKDIYFDKYTFYYGGNRGRGQVYPTGELSNNNQFTAPAAGTIKSIEGLKVTIEKEDGSTAVQTCGAGATLVVSEGEKVKQGDPLTTNPNVGGFGQEEKEMVLQDMNRIYAYCALGTSIFFSQLAFVLKKKQFEKVQLAEGF
jgi:apocytochrome f